MSTQTGVSRNATFRVGWVPLLMISTLAALGHIILGLTIPDEATLFVGWAAFNMYSTAVLYVPFRRGETWAWYTTWVLAVGFALPILFTRESFAVWYLGAASVMTVGLILTRPAFFSKGRVA